MFNTNLYKYLISDENIYLAIYSLETYVFDPELLSIDDKKLLNKLRDKYNYKLIKLIIKQVRDLIIELLQNKIKYIDAQVYFKPKQYKSKMKYRPIHTTGIINQIAIVAMLNILIYEMPGNNKKLVMSNLSRLIPSNFYGNRISLKPNELFKPWKNQYKEYTKRANEFFKSYHNSLKYRYEVTLDLEDFFPSVNPLYLYGYIIHKMPVSYSDKERELYSIVLIKLLYCTITNLNTKFDIEHYYSKSENYDKESIKFSRGIPQGLPQSYFLGNICMIEIANIFNKKFEGESLFYVDDSVIFTNDVEDEESRFQQQLEEINISIEKIVTQYVKLTGGDKFIQKHLNYLDQTSIYLSDNYMIRVHVKSGKSSYTRIDMASEEEVYLKCISREVSQVGGHMLSLYSDEEEDILREKTTALVNILEREMIKISEDQSKDVLDKNENKEVYYDKLVRYYKFFKYRMMKFNIRSKLDINDIYIKDIVYLNGDTSIDINTFMQYYKNDIWSAAVSLLIRNISEENDKNKLVSFLIKVNNAIYSFDNRVTSFIYKIYEEFLTDKITYNTFDKYKSLNKYVEKALYRHSHKQAKIIADYVENIIEKVEPKNILYIENILPKEFIKIVQLVDSNTDEMKRMLLNSVYSYLFNVEVSDRFVLAMRSKKSLTYGELRKIILVRHTNFSINIYKSIDIKLLNENNRIKIDYSIMEVLEIFRVYINQPILIDNLILTHQYTCDVWKNGSKLLYFYTLHNQEHAVGLIKNIIKLVKAIDYIKISSQDYYMLFIASYLHDISMVKIPHSDCFLLDNFSADNIASEMIEKIDKLIEDNKYKDVTNIKKLIVNTYKKVEDFYSNYVRDKHANDSANEIRTRDELNYLDKCLRELVADIAIAHCYDVHDIYHIKSEASTRLVSVKFDKILLRLADLLDMDDFRISRSILNHNLEHMSLESAFHWISHLLTKGYKIETFYEVNDKSSLKPKSVIEKLVITIFVDISQLSEIINNSKCKCVKILSNKITAEGIEILCGDVCNNDKCNFLCKWFTRKNSYLIEELSALNQYLRRVPDNYFDSDVVIKVQVSDKTKLDAKLFEIIKEYITDNSEI